MAVIREHDDTAPGISFENNPSSVDALELVASTQSIWKKILIISKNISVIHIYYGL